MSTLKPCPFCGGEAAENRDISNSIYCKKCFAEIDTDCVDWNTRPIEDALNARIAELEERLELCESALTSMVYQFFYSSESGALVHSFMSAEEETAEYLVDYGIARWENEHKNSIVFEEAQE